MEDNETLTTRRVVVGVDDSPNARLAVEHATRRVGPEGQLIVAHVMRPVTDPVAKVMPTRDEPWTVARHLVDQMAETHAPGADPVVLEGSAANRLAELARERRADEIVVGSRGRGRFTAALGSVSHALVQQADRPVVVVPAAAADHPRERQGHGNCTVVVGYDGSDPARAALSYAVDRASKGGRVIAVHAFESLDWLGNLSYEQTYETDEEHGRQLLESLRGAVTLDVELDTSLVEGPAAAVIVVVAKTYDADEIVVGSRGLGTVRGLLGSVSHTVLHETDRVVVIVPAGL